MVRKYMIYAIGCVVMSVSAVSIVHAMVYDWPSSSESSPVIQGQQTNTHRNRQARRGSLPGPSGVAIVTRTGIFPKSLEVIPSGSSTPYANTSNSPIIQTPKTPHSRAESPSLAIETLRKTFTSLSVQPVHGSPNTSGLVTPSETGTPVCDRPLSNSSTSGASPFLGSPTAHCKQNTEVVEMPIKELETLEVVLHKARIFWGADFSSTNDAVPIELGTINWVENPKEKTIAISSTEMSYREIPNNPDNETIKKELEEKLIRFVTEKAKELQYKMI